MTSTLATTMPLQVLEVSEEQAKAKLLAYRELLKQERTRENELIAAGLREIAAGRAVITLSSTIAAGGFDELGRPKLAVCRADAKRCFVERRSSRAQLLFGADGRGSGTRSYSSGVAVGKDHVTARQAPPVPAGVPWPWAGYMAVVPNVPPEHRVWAHRGVGYEPLGKFHLLWEATWQEAPAPRDPALIRHIGGELWAVHAVWDLTPLEAAVLAGRL